MAGGSYDKIFINYRRGDDPGFARSLFDRLKGIFGEDRVFMDVDTLGATNDFAAVLDKEIRACGVLLVIIGKNWLGANDDQGRRLGRDDDYVTREIGLALRLDKLVMPILVNGAPQLRKDDLPPVLHPLVPCQAFPLVNDRFEGDIQRIIKAITKHFGSGGAPVSGTISNITIMVPQHFLGRDDAFKDITEALGKANGRAAITALHGMRGVGKTTLAAAYAQRHRGDYRTIWWIKAEEVESLRGDLTELGARLGWVAADVGTEEVRVRTVLQRLREDGHRILLIFDNAIDADSVMPYLPSPDGGAQALVTSNSHAWNKVAEPVEIRVWPNKTGADFLEARTGRAGERAGAESLSETLGGLPLALEQAAAYCEQTGASFATYQDLVEAEPEQLLDDQDFEVREYHVLDDQDFKVREYHEGRTVATTFNIGVKAAKTAEPLAESLIAYAALLAPEPIPLSLLSEALKHSSEKLHQNVASTSHLKAMGKLLAFGLVKEETVPSAQDASGKTECFRLHRLVKLVAAQLLKGDQRSLRS